MDSMIWNKENQSLLFKGLIGIEKEGLRVTQNGEIASTPHPDEFGCKLENPYITTDFSESQVEMITPAEETPEKAATFLDNINNIVAEMIGNELIWPGSMPPAIKDEKDIIISNYPGCDGGKSEESYRHFLAKKYGKKKQLISGIHYNFSLHHDLIKQFKVTETEIYLKVARNFITYRWLLVYLFGASPLAHESLLEKRFEGAISLRNSSLGYTNKEKVHLSYNSIEEHVVSFKEALKKGAVEYEKELYAPIRLRTKRKPTKVDDLLTQGISYIEIRNLDLNLLHKNGISTDEIQFVYIFLLFCLYKESKFLSEEEIIEADANNERVALYGRDENLTLTREGQSIELKAWGMEVLKEINDFINKITDNKTMIKSVDKQLEKMKDRALLPSQKIYEGIEVKGYHGFILDKARDYKKVSTEYGYRLKGYEDLELSTQILMRGAIKRGVAVKVLDRQDNFIELSYDGKKEYVKQATKTSLDRYSTFLMMENKVVSKYIMDQAGIRVPKGESYDSETKAKQDFKRFENKAIVVKPKSTNFGIGISIIKELKDRKTYEKAVSMAFEHDRTALVEEFLEGKEYRFLVLGDETVGILHRVPANVKGNGKDSIITLVEMKNQDPLRGKGYKTPLEKIKIGEPEKMFLAMNGWKPEDVPKMGEVVYLRENSNISTGGDSLDFTDEIHQGYKDIAVKAAHSAGAVVCGVDLMLKDIKATPSEDNYGVIEINFNPAIHIHDFPYKGKNRKVEEKLLDLLF